MNYRLRSATLDDEPMLEEIERASFESGHWAVADFRGQDCTVIEFEGRVAGFVVTQQVYAGDETSGPEVEILNLAVLPALRGMGFARALLAEVLSKSATFFLEVRESNERALRLYGEFGFSEVARRASYYEDPDESAIVMRAERC